MKQQNKKMDEQLKTSSKLPISKNEDVEFSRDQADENDMEAAKRAEAAEQRQQ